MRTRVPSSFWAAACLLGGAGASPIRAEAGGAEAVVAVERLGSEDIRLQTVNVSADWSPARRQFVFSATSERIAVDYAPAKFDILSLPASRAEQRSAAELTMRFRTDAEVGWFAGAGGYRGFTDFRSVWLNEYYRQLFEGVPGYVSAGPRGWHALTGGRWAYVPGSAILQATVVRQDDTVSPGYEPEIGHPLRRGRDRLRTTAARISTENVVTPTLRTLLEIGAAGTTGRETRFTAQGSLNWSVTEALTLRTVIAGVRERPAFQARSAALTLEHDWSARWFAGLTARMYRDSGEVVDPLLVSSAAPALRTVHVAASLRWQGERAAVRLEGGPYRTRYDEIAAGSAHFARLYSDRNWRRVQGTASWKF